MTIGQKTQEVWDAILKRVKVLGPVNSSVNPTPKWNAVRTV